MNTRHKYQYGSLTSQETDFRRLAVGIFVETVKDASSKAYCWNEVPRPLLLRRAVKRRTL